MRECRRVSHTVLAHNMQSPGGTAKTCGRRPNSNGDGGAINADVRNTVDTICAHSRAAAARAFEPGCVGVCQRKMRGRKWREAHAVDGLCDTECKVATYTWVGLSDGWGGWVGCRRGRVYSCGSCWGFAGNCRCFINGIINGWQIDVNSGCCVGYVFI